LSSRVAIEGWNATQHCIKNNPTAPNINFLVVVSPHDHFRRHVIRGAHHTTHAPALAEPLGGAEVGEFKVVGFVEQEVFGFDVSVGESERVAVREGFEELFGEGGGVGLR